MSTNEIGRSIWHKNVNQLIFVFDYGVIRWQVKTKLLIEQFQAYSAHVFILYSNKKVDLFKKNW